MNNAEDEYSDCDSMISEGDDPDQEYTHPYTGERFTVDSLQSDPEFQDILAKAPKCSDPGHSCRRNFEEFTKTYLGGMDLIPEEKTPLKIVPREKWCALTPRGPEEPLTQPSLKVVCAYNPGVGPCYSEAECKKAVRELQRMHMEDWGLPDIAYNFVIGGDMNIYVGRGWHTQPDNSLKYPQWRHRRIDLAFLAELVEETKAPELEVLDKAIEFMDIGIFNNYLSKDYDIYENREPPKISNTDSLR